MKLGIDNMEHYRRFIEDVLVGNLVLGGKCKNDCKYCDLKATMGAIGIENYTNLISMENVKDVISFLGIINRTGQISVGEGNHFLSCEPLMHPKYLDIVKLVRKKFPNRKIVTLTTGELIKPGWYETLKQLNIRFIVSVNTMDQKEKSELMRTKTPVEHVIDFLEKCEFIIDTLSFVYFGKLKSLERDIKFIHELHPNYKNKTFRIILADYSVHHDLEAKELHDFAKKTWHEANYLMHELHPNFEAYIRNFDDYPELPPKVHYKRIFFNSMRMALETIQQYRLDPSDVGFLFPESSYSYAVRELNFLKDNAILVKNITFAGSYQASGLMTMKDIRHALNETKKKFKYYIAPYDLGMLYKKDLAGEYIDENIIMI